MYTCVHALRPPSFLLGCLAPPTFVLRPDSKNHCMSQNICELGWEIRFFRFIALLLLFFQASLEEKGKLQLSPKVTLKQQVQQLHCVTQTAADLQPRESRKCPPIIGAAVLCGRRHTVFTTEETQFPFFLLVLGPLLHLFSFPFLLFILFLHLFLFFLQKRIGEGGKKSLSTWRRRKWRRVQRLLSHRLQALCRGTRPLSSPPPLISDLLLIFLWQWPHFTLHVISSLITCSTTTSSNSLFLLLSSCLLLLFSLPPSPPTLCPLPRYF